MNGQWRWGILVVVGCEFGLLCGGSRWADKAQALGHGWQSAQMGAALARRAGEGEPGKGCGP